MAAPNVTVIGAYQTPGSDEVTVIGTIEGAVDRFGHLLALTAVGWKTAITNYFPPTAYNADSTFKAGQTPRAMTAPERLAYAKRILLDQNADLLPASVSAPDPNTVIPPGVIPTNAVDLGISG